MDISQLSSQLLASDAQREALRMGVERPSAIQEGTIRPPGAEMSPTEIKEQQLLSERLGPERGQEQQALVDDSSIAREPDGVIESGPERAVLTGHDGALGSGAYTDEGTSVTEGGLDDRSLRELVSDKAAFRAQIAGRDIPQEPGVREDSPYSSEITDKVRTIDELDVYKEGNLEEKEVNGDAALTRTDIDPNRADAKGRSNTERMNAGKPPIGDDGKPVELHHVGQKQDSPLAELTSTEHRQNSGALHDSQPSEVSHSSDWAKQKADYWKARSADFES